MAARQHVLPLVAAALLCVASAFQEGEYVPAARRGQFHSSRTVWHDLLGRHCPRFGDDRMVAIPIPRPAGFAETGEYKVSFSIAGDRFYTSWLTIIGKHAPPVPIVHLQLTRSGDDIKAIKAKVDVAPPEYAEYHPELREEFGNATLWPKHLLVMYSWREIREVDAPTGLALLFAAGLVAMFVLAVFGLQSYQDKLLSFVEELTADEGLAAHAPLAVGKAD